MPRQFMLRDPNQVDRAALERNLDIYYEFPPRDASRDHALGRPIDRAQQVGAPGLHHETGPEALKQLAADPAFDHFSYVFMCYARLR